MQGKTLNANISLVYNISMHKIVSLPFMSISRCDHDLEDLEFICKIIGIGHEKKRN